jgi:hypothetical protein
VATRKRGLTLPFVHVRYVNIPRWKLALGAMLFIGLLIALFILAAGVFLLILPVVAVTGALAYLFGGRTKKSDLPDGVIEAEYREIKTRSLEKDKK